MDKDKKTSGFSKPPLSVQQKEKQIKRILSGANPEIDDEEPDVTKIAVTIRIPEYYLKDIDRIKRLTGQTKNSIYIDLLRNAIKQKLRELEDK